MPALAREVSLFRNGRNQALRIPREFELPGDSALMYQDGARLIIEPEPQGTFRNLFASWTDLGDSFTDLDDEVMPLDEDIF
jgi:antitoxin VapB